jgi:Transposase DDE domain group 1
MAGERLADARTGNNGRHALVGMLRQSVFGRLTGYEDVNDAERLRHDPATRWIVGGKAASGCAASASQMGRFETRWLTAEKNLSALDDLSGQWIDRVHARRPPRGVVLDMDSSVSPTHGDQENSVWNGHYACTCCHPLFVFNQFGDLERGWVFLRIAVLASSIVMWVRPRDAASEQFRKCYRLRQLGLIRGVIRGIPA